MGPVLVQEETRARLAPEGDREFLQSPRRETLASLPGKKLTVRRGIFTDGHTFIYCTNYEYLILI